jgi:hypothetical protein
MQQYERTSEPWASTQQGRDLYQCAVISSEHLRTEMMLEV